MLNSKKIAWILVILWMGFIFYFSHQPATASSELSRGVSEVIITAVETVVPHSELDIRELNHIIRKNAHFFIYLLLGMLVIRALHKSGLSGGIGVGVALLICLLYAITDEVHQIFVPGRSGEMRDVLIDTAGASVGVGLYLLMVRCVRRFSQ